MWDKKWKESWASGAEGKKLSEYQIVLEREGWEIEEKREGLAAKKRTDSEGEDDVRRHLWAQRRNAVLQEQLVHGSFLQLRPQWSCHQGPAINQLAPTLTLSQGTTSRLIFILFFHHFEPFKAKIIVSKLWMWNLDDVMKFGWSDKIWVMWWNLGDLDDCDKWYQFLSWSMSKEAKMSEHLLNKSESSEVPPEYQQLGYLSEVWLLTYKNIILTIKNPKNIIFLIITPFILSAFMAGIQWLARDNGNRFLEDPPLRSLISFPKCSWGNDCVSLDYRVISNGPNNTDWIESVLAQVESSTGMKKGTDIQTGNHISKIADLQSYYNYL